MDIDELEKEIARLSARPYSQIGVPMYIVAEDLCDRAGASAPRPAPRPAPTGSSALSRAFDEAVAALEARRGPLKPEDLAKIIEVLAEHSFLDRPFSTLSGEDPT